MPITPDPYAARSYRLARPPAGALWLAAMVAAGAGCGVDDRPLVALCDSTNSDPGCPDHQVCVATNRIGGDDFCTASCGAPGDSPDVACVAGNAELTTCDPAADLATDGSCGQPSFRCLRTNVIPGSSSAAGVCLPIYPCTLDADCRSPTESSCQATLLQQLYPNDTDLAADHLSCLQRGCQELDAACSPGQACLPIVLPASEHVPDICVQTCDSRGYCPPSFFCDQTVNGPASPDVCIPGLLGFGCQTDVDCLMGTCLSDGDPVPDGGLTSCSVACTDDADCTKFDSPLGLFVCVKGHCETPSSYTRTICFTDADCVRFGSVCSYEAPPLVFNSSGVCLFPCSGDSECGPRGGMGQACVPFFDHDGTSIQACWPGTYGLPCTTDSECVGDLTCLSGLCSVPCLTDNDCDAERWTEGSSYCAGSICEPKLPGGVACTGNSQCQTNSCSPSGTDGGTVCAL